MKKLQTKLLSVSNLSLIIIFLLYAFIGIIISFIGSLSRPKNKAIALLKSIRYLDLYYSGKFILTTTFIVIGSLGLIITLCKNNLRHYKYQNTIITLAKNACRVWCAIALSLFLLNSFKENVYNLITVIIATGSSIWNITGKITSSFIEQIGKKSRKAPKYPPRRLYRHRR